MKQNLLINGETLGASQRWSSGLLVSRVQIVVM